MTGPEVIFTRSQLQPGTAAHHLRAAFAERHVPLPDRLASSLANFLTSSQPMRDAFWGRSFTCMARALGVSGSVGAQVLLRGGLARFSQVVAEPLLRGAARTADTLPLHDAAAAIADTRTENRITALVDAALADPAVSGAPFWVHAGLDLIHFAQTEAVRRAAPQRGTAGVKPDRECDPALAALVFLHPPEFEAALLHDRPRRPPRQLSAVRRAGIHPKEGGVVGIRQSRNPEDLPDALFGDLILPKALFANKLVHEGLLVRHRPPRRDPKRDLLALTLMASGPEDGRALLVKAAWADAALRLRLALAQMGLANSDLVWSQVGAAFACLSCAVTEPGAERLPPLALAGKVRADMFLRTGLFPAFAELPPRTDPADRERGTEPASAFAPLLQQAVAKLAARHNRDRSTVTGEYGMRSVLVIGQFPGRQAPDWASLRADLLAGLGPDLGGRTMVACLGWPASPGLPLTLTGLRDGADDVTLTLPDPDHPERVQEIGLFLGRLVDWIMTATLEALDVAQG